MALPGPVEDSGAWDLAFPRHSTDTGGMRWKSLVLVGVGICLALVAWWIASITKDPAPSPVPPPSSAPMVSTTSENLAAGTPGAATAPSDTTSSDAWPAARKQAELGHVVRGVLWQGGAPLANAPLHVFAGPESKLVQVAATATAADGAFELPMPKTRFLFVVDGQSIPRGWWSGWQHPNASDWDLGVVHVPNAGAILGHVRDDAGNAVADALVQADGWGVARIPMLEARPKPAPVRTDAAGAFRLDGLQPGFHRLTAAVANHGLAEAEVVVVENGTASAEVKLHRGTLLEGVVLDWRGRPLPGATVQMESASETIATDASGRFRIEHYLVGKSLRVAGPGHIEDWRQVPYGDQQAEIQLGRAVTLRGIVRGGGGAEVTLHITAAKDLAEGAAAARPWELLDKPLPVNADGTFTIDGLSTSDFVVRANAASVGSSPPLRVALREDTTIELAIEASQGVRVQVRVQDPDGRSIDGAEVEQDLGVADYPSLYFGPHAQAQLRVWTSFKTKVFTTRDGGVVLPIGRDHPLAFLAKHPNFLPVMRLFAAAEVPAEVVVVLSRAGAVRGIVRGGAPAEYGRTVAPWRLEDEPKRLKRDETKEANVTDSWAPDGAPIDAEGRFVLGGLEPGAWRAAVARSGKARTSLRPDEQVGAVPLLDEGTDERAIVDFVVEAGGEAWIELVEPRLGTLRGQVRLRGAPCPSVQVVATRPGQLEKRWRRILEDGPIDWDDDLLRGWAAGQTTAADGSFTFRYTSAGPVELRLRHTQGAATSPPTILELPEPGADVVRALDLAAGSLRGRFLVEQLPEKERRFVRAVLYPMSKASVDPSYSTDYTSAVSWGCARVDLDERGEFAFDYLPDGDWLLRVEGIAMGCGSGPHWQRVVAVHGSAVDLGEVAPMPRVTAKFACRWPADVIPTTRIGVWLSIPHGGDPRAFWAGTFLGSVEGVACSVPPGRYTVVPFAPGPLFYGFGGVSGTAIASPVAIEVHADGSVSPPTIQFDAMPPTGDGR